ncbi:MAG: glycosyltransferase [Capsulimonadaceae bacterium]|nr:glycosyltransferase [Capsulimonadaceae bacterium]
MHDTIVIGMENWDGVWRRMQPVTQGIARRNPGGKHLFVGLSIDVSHAVRKGRLAAIAPALSWPKPRLADGESNVYLLNTIKLLPDTLTAGRLFNQAFAAAQIRSACRQLGIVRPVLYMNPHYAASLVGHMDECAAIYDIGDDWTSLPQKEATRRRTIREDRELCAKADAVVVVSETLFELKRPMTKKLYHIPNGVDVDRYLRVLGDKIAPLPLTSEWKRPVAAYTGTLHKDRVDLDLVVEIANRLPDVTLVFVGPVQLDDANRRKITAPGNVVLAGEVAYGDVPAVMAGFDVCMVPHRVTPFTMSLSPLKLYEYLASGLPIVATPVSGFRDYPDLIHLASDADAFAAGIRSALAEPAAQGAARQTLAREHSWDKRFDAIEAVIIESINQRTEEISCRQSVPSYR